MMKKQLWLLWVCVALSISGCISTGMGSPITVFPTTSQNLVSTTTPAPTQTKLPSETLTLQPTKTPRPTRVSSPSPTLTRTHSLFVRPLANDSTYVLSKWSEEKALNVLDLLEEHWNDVVAFNSIYGDAFNPQKRYLAIVGQEALLRYPNMQNAEDVKWKIAFNLAVSGEQSATTHIIQLISDELSKQPPAQPEELKLDKSGFDYEWFVASNLFGEDTQGWILKISLGAGSNYAGGGSIIVIRKQADGFYKVEPLYSYWQPFFADGFGVTVEDHTADQIPEVTVFQSQQHGMGSFFAENWRCIYQWQNDAWESLLIGVKSDYAQRYLDAPLMHQCLALGGYAGGEYLPDETQAAEQIVITKRVDNLDCGEWWIKQKLTWDGSKYRQQVVLELPSEIDNSSAHLCVRAAWDWSELLENKAEIISVTEKVLAGWSELEKAEPDHFTVKSDRDLFRFQLARLYALNGDSASARSLLLDIVNHPSDPAEENRWLARAKAYLENLPNVDKAEKGLADEPLASSPSEMPEILFPDDVIDKAVVDLFEKSSVERVIVDLQAAIANPKLGVSEDVLCSQLIPSDEPFTGYLYQQNGCAAVYYLLGLAYEIHGETDKAVSVYWRLWRDYPDSFYAIVVQHKFNPAP